jgi:acetyltransferase
MEEDAAHQMGKMVAKKRKPIILHSLYSSEKPHSLDLLRYYNIPVYDSLDVACKCISVLATYGAYRKAYHAKTNFVLKWGERELPEGKALIEKAVKENRSSLLEPEAKDLLRCHGVKIAPEQLVQTADEAIAAANTINGAAVLKIVSPDILHKSDANGVALDLETEKEIRRSFEDITRAAKRYNPRADIRGVLVSPMAKTGVEVIIGTKIDDQFGPVVMYGMGGVMVEILKDVAFRVLPLSRHGAKMLIQETKSSAILDGVRGAKAVDKNALIRLLLTTSELMEAYPDIKEMDLNPVIVHAEGCTVVDARILLKET